MFAQVVPLQAVPADAGEIGTQLALIAAVAATMQLFLAPTLHAQVEALQASQLVPKKMGGVAAIVLGSLYGVAVGVLGATQTDKGWYLVLVGLIGGIVAGGGAVIADQRIDGLVAKKTTGTSDDSAAGASGSTNTSNTGAGQADTGKQKSSSGDVSPDDGSVAAGGSAPPGQPDAGNAEPVLTGAVPNGLDSHQ